MGFLISYGFQFIVALLVQAQKARKVRHFFRIVEVVRGNIYRILVVILSELGAIIVGDIEDIENIGDLYIWLEG